MTDRSRPQVNQNTEGQSAGYEAYRARRLTVPGDHAPGRILTYQQWRQLTEELTQLSAQTDKESAQRCRWLRKALLIVEE